MSDTDLRHMTHALALGRRGIGRVWPNPAVGCVIVRDGRVVGRGWTQDGGRPHAEVMALRQAGDAARGATAYVTLEPCNHHGKSGPCSEALVSAGLERVVSAIEDPDPRVKGSGHDRLRQEGIKVSVGVCEAEAAEAHAGFFSRVRHNRPLITLKLASSFDGRIATGTGQSQWITGPAARRSVHAMRATHDAVMVGGRTARHDDPSLTVRDLGVNRQPVRVVISRRLDLPLMGQLARTAQEIPVWLCHGRDTDPDLQRTWTDLGAKLIPCDTRGGHLDMTAVLAALAERGLTRVFCEGGGALAASLLEADLVDRLIVFTAGLGIGAEGLPSVGALGLEHLQDARRFVLQGTNAIGGDVVQTWMRPNLYSEIGIICNNIYHLMR